VDSLAAKRLGDYVDQNDEHGVRFEGEAEKCIRVEGSTALLVGALLLARYDHT